MKNYELKLWWTWMGVVALWVWPWVATAQPNVFVQENYTSDVPGLADHTDPNLVNPWGIAFSATGPFWIGNNLTGTSTLYNGEGEPFPLAGPLVVGIPPAPGGAGPGTPTGTVFNGRPAFELAPGMPARFLFATLDGTISGWNPAANPTAAIVKVASIDAVYTGLAIGNNGTADLLYAANFHSGRIDVFDSSFAPTTLSGSFTDPGLPSGYSPFNIQQVAGSLFVMYALQDPATGEELPGAGNGFVSEFDLDGNLVRRLASGGVLNAPWGIAATPDAFGPFGDSLLVGNFGDGTMNAFDPITGDYLGALEDPSGDPIVIEGLWGLIFGNGGTGGEEDDLYFTAGIDDETHGLFGEIAPMGIPEPGNGEALLVATLVVGCLGRIRRAQG